MRRSSRRCSFSRGYTIVLSMYWIRSMIDHMFTTASDHQASRRIKFSTGKQLRVRTHLVEGFALEERLGALLAVDVLHLAAGSHGGRAPRRRAALRKHRSPRHDRGGGVLVRYCYSINATGSSVPIFYSKKKFRSKRVALASRAGAGQVVADPLAARCSRLCLFRRASSIRRARCLLSGSAAFDACVAWPPCVLPGALARCATGISCAFGFPGAFV
jgi:hypothetical protein